MLNLIMYQETNDNSNQMNRKFTDALFSTFRSMDLHNDMPPPMEPVENRYIMEVKVLKQIYIYSVEEIAVYFYMKSKSSKYSYRSKLLFKMYENYLNVRELRLN